MQPSQPAEKANVSSADLRRAAWTCSLSAAHWNTTISHFTAWHPPLFLVHSFFLIRNREWR